jgi:hypothetical protein
MIIHANVVHNCVKMNTLTLEQGNRKGENITNGTSKTERKYIDFIISGLSLGQSLGLPKLDLIGTFGWSQNKEYENQQIDEFLGSKKPELRTGRTPFYICPECGDISCGAITAKIEVSDKWVIWKDFGFENDYSEPDFSDYKAIGPFIFDKDEYFKIIGQLKQIE